MERIPAGRFAAACAVAGLAAIAVVSFLRRLAVGSSIDLPAGEAAAYAAAFSFVAALAIRALAGGKTPRVTGLGDAAAFFMALVFAAGLTAEAVSILACVIASGGTLGLLAAGDRGNGAEAAAGSAADRAVGGGELTGTRSSAGTAGPPPDGGLRSGGATLDEWGTTSGGSLANLVRSTRDGREVLDGALRFEMPAGETGVVLHVPVWPPLAGEPTVTCVLDGIDGRVRVPFAKSHGFRIEVRVPAAVDEPLTGLVRFVAECKAKAA